MKVWVPTYQSCDDGCTRCENIGYTTKEAAMDKLWADFEEFKIAKYGWRPEDFKRYEPTEDNVQEIEIR